MQQRNKILRKALLCEKKIINTLHLGKYFLDNLKAKIFFQK